MIEVKTYLHYLIEQNIQIYSTKSDLKAVFVERFNRTLLDLIKEPKYIEGKGNWLNPLDDASQKYNNRVHGPTKMTPFEAKNKPIDPPTFVNKPKQPKFQVEDFVRVPDKCSVHSKSYTTNWNRELFQIHSINETSPVTYTLEVENKEIIQGKYYEQELLKSVFNFDSNNKTLESMNIFHQYE